MSTMIPQAATNAVIHFGEVLPEATNIHLLHHAHATYSCESHINLQSCNPEQDLFSRARIKEGPDSTLAWKSVKQPKHNESMLGMDRSDTMRSTQKALRMCTCKRVLGMCPGGYWMLLGRPRFSKCVVGFGFEDRATCASILAFRLHPGVVNLLTA